jgi:hypothetical protein
MWESVATDRGESTQRVTKGVQTTRVNDDSNYYPFYLVIYMKKIDFFMEYGYDFAWKVESTPFHIQLTGLLKMKAAIRFFALFVAFAGLISASFSAPPSRALSSHMSVAADGPGPLTLPYPPCPNGPGTCLVSPPSNR